MNPNKQFKRWWTGDEPPSQPDSQEAQSSWKSWLLCLPKNLVYVFLIVVLGSFAAMSYITFSEKDLKKFMLHSRPSVTETDALYIYIQNHNIMNIDTHKVPEESEYSLSSFI